MFEEKNKKVSKPEGTFTDPEKVEESKVEVEYEPEDEGVYPEITKFYDVAPDPEAPTLRVRPLSKRPPKAAYDPKQIVLHKPTKRFGHIRD